MDQNQISRPKKVGTAVNLLYIVLGIRILQTILEASMASARPSMFIIFCVLAVMWLVIYMIGKGRNWARITYLILFIIGLRVSVVPLWAVLGANPIPGLLVIAQLVIQIIALVFLFQKPSSDWFREMKAKK